MKALLPVLGVFIKVGGIISVIIMHVGFGLGLGYLVGIHLEKEIVTKMEWHLAPSILKLFKFILILAFTYPFMRRSINIVKEQL